MNIIKTLFLYTLLISELVFETCGSLKQTFHRMSFVCDICNFVSHKKTHSDRSFVCERCGDSCNRKDALKHHIWRNTLKRKLTSASTAAASFTAMTCIQIIRKCVNSKSKLVKDLREKLEKAKTKRHWRRNEYKSCRQRTTWQKAAINRAWS